MAYKKSIGEIWFDSWNYLFMFCLMILTLYPVLHVAFASISNGTELMAHRGILLWPLGFTLDAYKMVFKNPMIIRGYLNTMIILIVGLLVNLTLTAFGAYFLSRKKLFWKKPIMLLIIFSMYFHGGLIPTFLTVKGMGLFDSLWALILPKAINTFNLILMTTSFATIPDSLEESARIDGANDFTILFRIIVPLSKPILAVMLLYYGVYHWNAWFDAMVYLRERALFPLQLVLREILIVNDTANMSMGTGLSDQEQVGESIKYATIMVATVPILMVYPFLQKYLVKGVMIGAIKG
jgi:putative aldouronate transport system permease protein